MLDLLDIRWEYFPTEEDAVAPALDRATRHMKETGLSYGFVMRKDSVAPYALKERSGVNEASKEAPVAAGMSVVPTGDSAVPAVKRGPMLKAVQHAVRTEDLVLATTGYTGRELYALDDRPNQFYMVGSMGCASSFGLGIALARPDRRVIVLDGDGAVLMRMGALCTIGTERPRNLIHIVFDNGAYESTGGQKTVSRGVDLCAVARACGYERTMEVSDPKELEKALEEHRNDALTFIRVPILSGVPENLPRPEIAPPEVARRFSRGFK
jgi:phosphonopyruvate decarboxylase